MNEYDLIKCFHLTGAIMMVGATLCNGIIHLGAMKAKLSIIRLNSLHNILSINKLIMLPGFVLIIFPGVLLANQINTNLDEGWFLASVILTTVLLVEFVWGYQLERQLVSITLENLQLNPKDYENIYGTVLKRAIPIGSTAAIISFLVIYLMIGKPF